MSQAVPIGITITVRYFASIREALGGQRNPVHRGRHRGRAA